MPKADSFSFNYIDTIRQYIEKQITNSLVQEINLINIQHSPMGFSQKTRLENSFPLFHRLLNINRPNESVFCDS